MNTEIFGTTADGQSVERAVLQAGGLTAKIMSFGAVLQDLRLEGHSSPLVLGFDRFEDYPRHSRYFGATAGRCANRIAGASFTLDGAEYRLDPNFLGKHHLHGGSQSIGKRLWTFSAVERDSATLTLDLADGEMGYPGAMSATVRFALLPEGVLDIRMRATTARPTLCNLAHHSYFNLSGEATILNHRLQIAAEHYLPVDEELIPTGSQEPVAGTALDFGSATRLGAVCAATRLDHNFCLSNARSALRDVAALTGGKVTMRIRTTEPGLQVYDGAPLDLPVPGLDGRPIGAYAGIALEPQVWPDAIHHPDWPQAILRPGETYDQHTQFVFGKAAS